MVVAVRRRGSKKGNQNSGTESGLFVHCPLRWEILFPLPIFKSPRKIQIGKELLLLREKMVIDIIQDTCLEVKMLVQLGLFS